MKVILTQDVKGKGKRGQMVEVSDGYARNFLLPKKLAQEATADNVNTMRMNDKALAEKQAKRWKFPSSSRSSPSLSPQRAAVQAVCSAQSPTMKSPKHWHSRRASSSTSVSSFSMSRSSRPVSTPSSASSATKSPLT